MKNVKNGARTRKLQNLEDGRLDYARSFESSRDSSSVPGLNTSLLQHLSTEITQVIHHRMFPPFWFGGVTDVLITILTLGATVADVWKAIEHIFIDKDKNLSDQLTDMDAPVDNQCLVLQLIASLTDQCDSIATHLQQSTPLPDFYTTRSKLCLEETRKSLQTPTGNALRASSVTTVASPSANVVTSGTHDQRDISDTPQSHHPRSSVRGTSEGLYRGRGRGMWGRGRGLGRGRGSYTQQQQPPWRNWNGPTWNSPLVPYPTAPRYQFRPPTAGILGHSPAYAYVVMLSIARYSGAIAALLCIAVLLNRYFEIAFTNSGGAISGAIEHYLPRT
uniref:Uncharacterized protein n=1 Tax=Lactuca sativa TaxID=4236 RepID=A0A9R1X264_LACSA|nr:hypothetical protein LSAT_V11C700367690 [Lactuca sativa]